MTRTAFCKEGGEGGGGGGRRAEGGALAAGRLSTRRTAIGCRHPQLLGRCRRCGLPPPKKKRVGSSRLLPCGGCHLSRRSTSQLQLCASQNQARSFSIIIPSPAALPLQPILLAGNERTPHKKKTSSFLLIVAVKNLKALPPEAGRPALAFVFLACDSSHSTSRERRVLILYGDASCRRITFEESQNRCKWPGEDCCVERCDYTSMV